MGVIRVEPQPPPKQEPCERCGGTSHLLHGYVYDDDFAHGIYFVEWCEGPHPGRAAFLTVGLGAFGEGTTGADRMAFAIEWNAAGMRLLGTPVRDRPDLLGRFVPRDEALGLPDVGHLWHVTDHIVAEDPRLAPLHGWLDAGEPAS